MTARTTSVEEQRVLTVPEIRQPTTPVKVSVRGVPNNTASASTASLAVHRPTQLTLSSMHTAATDTWAALTYSARRYDSAVCCSKISCDAFLSEALYEADKALEKLLEKFTAAPRECACLQDGGWSRRWIANVCFILLFCIIWVLAASIFVYVCFVDCCIAASLQTIK